MGGKSLSFVTAGFLGIRFTIWLLSLGICSWIGVLVEGRGSTTTVASTSGHWCVRLRICPVGHTANVDLKMLTAKGWGA